MRVNFCPPRKSFRGIYLKFNTLTLDNVKLNRMTSNFARNYIYEYILDILAFLPLQSTLGIYRNLDHYKAYQPNTESIVLLSSRTLGSIKQPLLSQEDVSFCDSSIGS